MDNQKDNNIKDISLASNPVRWSKYVSLKGQKLTQAVYLVTSMLPESEPLKWRLRDISLDILSDISLAQPLGGLSQIAGDQSHISPFFKVSVLESASLKIAQIVSWLNVALAGNFSTDLNLVILRDEYLKFNDTLHERIATTNLQKMLEPELAPLEFPLSTPKLSFKEDIGQTVTNKTDIRHYQKISQLPHKNRDVAKDSRRTVIIDFLKGKDWTSIKDIADAVGGCSTKTIQRELSDLVTQGVLKKKGDRRWSRYLLA